MRDHLATLKAVTAAFNAHDLDAIMAFFADDCSLDMPRGPDPWGKRFEGRAAVREGLAPIIVEGLLSALKRLVADHSLAIILVEQHAKLALQVTQTALVLNRGRVSHFGPSAELLADPQRLTSLVVAQ